MALGEIPEHHLTLHGVGCLHVVVGLFIGLLLVNLDAKTDGRVCKCNDCTMFYGYKKVCCYKIVYEK